MAKIQNPTKVITGVNKYTLELRECMGCKEHQRRRTEVQCLSHHS